MFKKGVISDEISQDMREAAELAYRYKLDGVEIRSVWEKGPHELTDKDIKEIKTILSDYNLDVCGISAPFFKCDIDDQRQIDEHIEILKRCIDLSYKLDVKFIRGFTFWSKGDFNSYFDRIVSKFETPIELLSKNGKILVLEFDPSVFATNAQKLVQVIKAIDSPFVKGLWDPGNDIYDPDGERPFPDGYNIIKDHMVHMHLKDAKKLPDGKVVSTPIGLGEVEYEEHFSKLIEDRYEGYVVLETHYRPKHDLSEALLALPKGSAFSYLGYEASEDSLKRWQKIMDKIKRRKLG